MTRLMPLLILLITTATMGQTDRQLVDRFDRYESRAQYDRALDAALTITERHPESAHWAFNAGRLHAKLGQPDRAIAQLQRCADLGYTGIASFDHHEHLDTLRDRDDFRAITGQVRQNAARRMAEFQAEARNHAPPTFIPEGLDPSTKPALVIALHGTGGTGQQMLDALRPTCAELNLVCIAPDALRPAGTKPSSGFSWTYRDESEWLVEHFVTQAINDHNADPDRVYLVGFSQGANIALVLAQTRQNLIAAAVPICGHYEPGIAGSDDPPAPTYLLTGSRDNRKRTYTAARADFSASGGETALRVVNGMGHTVPGKRELTRALAWCLGRAGGADD